MMRTGLASLVTEPTLIYLQTVSGKRGDAAVQAWLDYSVAADAKGKKYSQEQRLARAAKNAAEWFADPNRLLSECA